ASRLLRYDRSRCMAASTWAGWLLMATFVLLSWCCVGGGPARSYRAGRSGVLRIREDGAQTGQPVAGVVVDVAAAATEDGGHLLRCEPDLECVLRGQVVGDTEGIGHGVPPRMRSARW